MRWRIFFYGFLHTLFVLYCVEAGAFLILVPWRPAWGHFAASLPWTGLQELLLTPIARGGVSGFGLVHLVWGIHDLEELLTFRRRLREREAAPSGG